MTPLFYVAAVALSAGRRARWRTLALEVFGVLLVASACKAQRTSVTISSQILGVDRTVHVQLPERYEESLESYPVLYLTDGESIDEMAPLVDSLVRAGRVPEMIIVGIPHPNRRQDLTPTPVERYRESGGAEPFFLFIADELIPYIDDAYRTQPLETGPPKRLQAWRTGRPSCS